MKCILNKIIPVFRYKYGKLLLFECHNCYHDTSKPLENFLFVHTRYRLVSLIRTKHYRKATFCDKCDNQDTLCSSCERRILIIEKRQNLMSPIDIANVRINKESCMHDNGEFDNIEIQELVSIIDAELPLEYRADYLRMKDGAMVPKNKRDIIEECIKGILVDYE